MQLNCDIYNCGNYVTATLITVYDVSYHPEVIDRNATVAKTQTTTMLVQLLYNSNSWRDHHISVSVSQLDISKLVQLGVWILAERRCCCR